MVKIHNTADSIKCNLCNPAKMLVLILKWQNDSETFVNFWYRYKLPLSICALSAEINTTGRLRPLQNQERNARTVYKVALSSTVQ